MSNFRSVVLVAVLPLVVVACGGSDDDSGTTGGAAGSGTAGSGTAGSGTAGSGTAGSGTAGSGTAGSGTAGSGTAGSATAGAAGSGTAGSATAGAAGSGTAGSGTSGGGGSGSGSFACSKALGSCLLAANGYCYEDDSPGLNQGTCMGVWSTDPCTKRSDFMAVGGCKASSAGGTCQTIWVQAKDSPDIQKQLCGPKGGTWVMP